MKQHLHGVLGPFAVVTNLALVTAALVHRRPMFDQTLHTAGLQVDSDQWGLAVNAALAVVVLGTALVYVLVRGLGRAVDAAIERRIAVPTRLASRVLDVTTAALQLEKTH